MDRSSLPLPFRSSVARYAAQAAEILEGHRSGDAAALEALLRADTDLASARSSRVTHFDPPVHRATLLHYVAANGVEGYNRKSPANAVDVARTLLDAGADVDALAGFYGGQYATMSLLVSSTPPAEAGVQVPLIELLVERGARLDVEDKLWNGTSLAWAIHGGRTEVETLLRAAGDGPRPS
jgi:hypothetical protein